MKYFWYRSDDGSIRLYGIMLPANGVSTYPEPVALLTKWEVLGSNSSPVRSVPPVGLPAPGGRMPNPTGPQTGQPEALPRILPKFASPPVFPAVHCGRGAVATRLSVTVVWRNCSKLKKKNVLSLPLYSFGMLTGPPSVNP